MHINLILIPLIIILGLILGQNGNRRNRRLYIILSSMVLILIASLRSPEWMTDTYNIDTLKYKDKFEQTFDMDWDELAEKYLVNYKIGDNNSDVGYIVLNKAISYVTHEFWIFSMIVNLLFFVPFGIILYRYTTHVRQIMFAYVFYVALIQVFIWSGARQMFSIGLDLMALIAIIDRKRIWAIPFFLLGLTIHFSSFLFLVPLLMIWFRFKPLTLKIMHVVCFLLFPFVLLFPNEVIVTMGDFLNMERYSEYGKNEIRGGADTFIFLIETLSFFLLIAIKKRDLSRHEKFRLFYVMAPLFTLFAPLIYSNGTMIRIALYYYVFLALLVPYGIECSTSKSNRRLTYWFAIGALSFLTLLGGGMTYYFYWQI